MQLSEIDSNLVSKLKNANCDLAKDELNGDVEEQIR